jgi:hypothetical protein
VTRLTVIVSLCIYLLTYFGNLALVTLENIVYNVPFPVATVLKRETWFKKGRTQDSSTYGGSDFVMSLILCVLVMRSV